MKYLFFLSILSCLACQPGEPNSTAMSDDTPSLNATTFLLGTYTNEASKGIYRYALKSDGTLDSLGLVVESIQPSFLAYTKDRDYVLAVNEVNDQDGMGTVESFAVKGDSLMPINKQSSGGAHPCHINVNDDGYVLTSNYSGGNIGMHQLAADGQLSELLFVEEHNKEEAKEAHAHSAWFYGNKNAVVSVDLGTDELWFSKIDEATNSLVPQEPAKLFIKEGAGPRHLSFHPNGQWAYVINELNSTVSLISVADPDSDREWEQLAAYSTLPDGYTEDSFCADIHISQDGKFIYASNRGHNSLAIYEVNPEDGTLKLLGHESVKGDWPRNFALSPDDAFVIVANQRSKNLVAFKRDPQTGLLTFTSDIKAPIPTCILF